MRRGGKPQALRPLADIRATLDAGPEWLTISQAADAVGVCEQSIYDRGHDGSILRTKTPSRRGPYTYLYHRAGVWAMAIELHDAEAYVFDSSADTRAAVLRMLDTWHDCETVQQLHDAAHVQPLPPIEHATGGHRPQAHEMTSCAMCGDEYERIAGSQAPRAHLCKSCRVRVGKRAGAQVRAFLARCSQP